jgi:hypothetical protein
LRRVHAPTGIGIDSETPKEIAVSIVAGLIKVRGTSSPMIKEKVNPSTPRRKGKGFTQDSSSTARFIRLKKRNFAPSNW